MEATPIEVDYREEQGVASHLILSLGVDLVAPGTNLRSGDLRWATEEGIYGVELKSASDFLHSLWNKKDGERLEAQLERLRHAVDFPILGRHGLLMEKKNKVQICKEPFLVGNHEQYVAKVVAHTNFQTESVDGFLWSIQNPQEGNSVYVIERPTKKWLLDYIVEIYQWSKKDEHKTFNHRLKQRSPSDEGKPGGYNQVALDMLISIPGIGEGRATAIFERFGYNIHKVFCADEKELVGIPMVGKDAAKRIIACGKELFCA